MGAFVDVRVFVDVWKRVVVCLWGVSGLVLVVCEGVCARVCVISTHERVTEWPYCTHSTGVQSINACKSVHPIGCHTQRVTGVCVTEW